MQFVSSSSVIIERNSDTKRKISSRLEFISHIMSDSDLFSSIESDISDWVRLQPGLYEGREISKRKMFPFHKTDIFSVISIQLCFCFQSQALITGIHGDHEDDSYTWHAFQGVSTCIFDRIKLEIYIEKKISWQQKLTFSSLDRETS